MYSSLMSGLNDFIKILGCIARLLGYVFLILRACDVTGWPWYMVLLPQFIVIGLHLFFALVVAIADDDD